MQRIAGRKHGGSFQRLQHFPNVRQRKLLHVRELLVQRSEVRYASEAGRRSVRQRFLTYEQHRGTPSTGRMLDCPNLNHSVHLLVHNFPFVFRHAVRPGIRWCAPWHGRNRRGHAVSLAKLIANQFRKFPRALAQLFLLLRRTVGPIIDLIQTFFHVLFFVSRQEVIGSCRFLIHFTHRHHRCRRPCAGIPLLCGHHLHAADATHIAAHCHCHWRIRGIGNVRVDSASCTDCSRASQPAVQFRHVNVN